MTEKDVRKMSKTVTRAQKFGYMNDIHEPVGFAVAIRMSRRRSGKDGGRSSPESRIRRRRSRKKYSLIGRLEGRQPAYHT